MILSRHLNKVYWLIAIILTIIIFFGFFWLLYNDLKDVNHNNMPIKIYCTNGQFEIYNNLSDYKASKFVCGKLVEEPYIDRFINNKFELLTNGTGID